MSLRSKSEDDKEMDVVGHLSELRTKLIITAIFFILFFILAFIFIKDIYYLFQKDMGIELNITSPGDIIWIYFTIAGLIAIVGTLPILSLQLWLFVKPGLNPFERKASLSYIPAIFLLFVFGLAFGYYIFVQLILPFLISLNEGMFTEMFTVERYFRFLFKVVIPFAVLFEMPIITMFLTSLGIITPDILKRNRKYAYLILLVVGAFVTPPDVVLQIVVAVPLFILFEVSIYFSSIVYRKKQKRLDSME